MAIYLISGAIGSGKSYYSVHRIKQLLDSDSPPVVLSNISNLSLPHKSLEDLASKNSVSLESDFWYRPFQDELIKSLGGSVVYFIDEAQQYFHSRLHNPKLFYFFQTHRHLGIDIFLITQDKKSLPIAFRDTLIEREFRALRRSGSLTGEFRYNVYVGDQIVDKMVLRPKKEIFGFYQSCSSSEQLKISNPVIKYAMLAVFVFCLCFIYALYSFSSWGNVSEASVNDSVPVSLSSSSLLPPSSPGSRLRSGERKQAGQPGVKQKQVKVFRALNYSCGRVWCLGQWLSIRDCKRLIGQPIFKVGRRYCVLETVDQSDPRQGGQAIAD